MGLELETEVQFSSQAILASTNRGLVSENLAFLLACTERGFLLVSINLGSLPGHIERECPLLNANGGFQLALYGCISSKVVSVVCSDNDLLNH